MKKSGFTLLELVVVIIIIGVLASLALPRMFAMVEGIKAFEAISMISTIRTSMTRCYLMNNQDIRMCRLNAPDTTIDAEDPSVLPNSHFSYIARRPPFASAEEWSFYIEATRNTRDNGDGRSKILFGQDCEVVVNAGGGTSTSTGPQYKGIIMWGASDIYKGFVPKN